MNKSIGIKNCEEALQRLLDGNPYVARHIGVESNDITSAMVSVEAGYDKGYLKKTRTAHKALIARIDSLKIDVKQKGDRDKILLKKALVASELHRKEAEKANEIMNKVLTQNLMLINKIKELEAQIVKQHSLGYMTKPHIYLD